MDDLGATWDGYRLEDGTLIAEALVETSPAWLAANPLPTLAQVKAKKLEDIDKRTKQLIAQGFEFPAASGQIFSLSADAQRSIQGLNHARDLPEFTFPVEWNTEDDTGKISIADSATAHNFFLVALATYRGHLDSGTPIKDQVRTAATTADVDAVTDSR